MPIVKISGRLVYFAHVPKCAGSAVEHYLQLRFGSLAFVDQHFLRRPEPDRWGRSSPQHITASSLKLLFPENFFDVCFAVVRHPVDRLISAYGFHRDVTRRIDAAQGFSEWLRSIPDTVRRDPWAYDNHVRPMYQFIPDGTRCFKLERGLAPVVNYLDHLAGDALGPRTIVPQQQKHPATPRIVPTPEDRDLIETIYERDFKIFRYQGDA